MSKHYSREQLIRERRRKLRIIIYAELVLVVLACMGVYMQYSHNVLMRQSAKAYAMVHEIDGDMIGSIAAKAYKQTNERIVEEVEEYMWTKEETVYRIGPDDSYKSAGTLDKEKMVERTGLTHNKWSRVSIDEKEYYILSDILTDETPISALIASGQKGEYQKYALSLFPDYGWSDRELEPLINLWERESHWNPNAHNRSSGAHGIPQSLPASKMASEGSDYYTNGKTQIRWGLKYIAGRYGSPSKAWAFFLSHNSY
ncbi:MAG: hypothetical protein IKE52_03215 [Mogibacterium sp.]|nr:hypothetical protein [Mogibacterium sp.]